MTTLPESVADTIKVENVVTSSDLQCNIDLTELSGDLPQSQYNAEQFPGLIYRSTDPKVTILLFRSGKIVCTGSKSFDLTEDALSTMLAKLDDLGLEYTSPDITVQNIVGVANFDSALNLNAIAIGLGLENTEYEPEQFPGLVYRLEDESAVVLLFGSGKMVITGAKSPEEIEDSVQYVHERLTDLALL